MKGLRSLQMLLVFVAAALAWTNALAESVIGAVSEEVEAPLDTSGRAVLAVAGGETAFPFAYNNTEDWVRGGDGESAAATIRLTEMQVQGAKGEPSGWTELAATTEFIGEAAEGTLNWNNEKRTYFRAELRVDGQTMGCAYFDYSAATGTWASSSVQILDPEQMNLTLFSDDGGYRVAGELVDIDGNVLTEGTDYRLELGAPTEGLPTTVTVVGLGAWTDNVTVPLAAGEVVMSVANLEDGALDTRMMSGKVRAINGVGELLALSRTNDADWQPDGLDDGPAATITVTPVVALPNDGKLCWLAVGESEALVSAAGEGVYGDWAPTGVGYRVTLTAGGETVESVVVDLTGYLEQRYGQVVIAGGNCPEVGKPLTVTLTDADGNEFTPTTITWARRTADRASTTMLAEGVNGYTPVAADLEHWLTLSIGGVGEAEASYVRDIWISKLPVAYVQVEGGATPTAAKEEHTGTLRLQGNAKWQSDKVLYDGKLDKIHVRGNSSAGFLKKPYKLKLDKKADLLGMGKNKHWVLLANYQDPGLMRNKITQDFSAELGLTAMASEWVDVIFNGEFVGNYQLCEHVRVDKERIDIHNWEDTAEEVAGEIAKQEITIKGEERSALEDALVDSMTADLNWLTTGTHTLNGKTYRLSDYDIAVGDYDLSGGYVYELDSDDDEPSKFRVTSGNLHDSLIKISAPEMLGSNSTLMDEQEQLWQDFFDAVQSENGYANGKSWAEMAEVRSMAAYWLTQVLAANYDVNRSRYAYKDQGGKLIFGPAWDYDVAYGGWAELWTLTANAAGEITSATPFYGPTYGWLVGVSTPKAIADQIGIYANFYPFWVDDPYFCLALYELWQQKREYLFGLVKDGGTMDQYREYLWESALANDARWPVPTRKNARVCDRFDGELGSFMRMKNALKEQIEWIDAQMTSLRTLVASFATAGDHPYVDATDKIAVNFVTEHTARPSEGVGEGDTQDVMVSNEANVEATVTLSGVTDPKTVEVYVNGIAGGSFAVAGDTATVTVDAERFTEVDGHRNMLALVAKDGNGATLARSYALVTTVNEQNAPQPISNATVTVAVGSEVVVTMQAIRPAVTITVGEGAEQVTLVEGEDYRVEYFNNVNVGTATVRITGLGNLSGTGEFPRGNWIGKFEQTFDIVVGSVLNVRKGHVAMDTRADAVRKLLSSTEMLPFAWNSAESWPRGGDGLATVTVSLQPMAGEDAADPASWTEDGAARTVVNAAGEGVKKVRATRLEKALYKATLSDGAEFSEEAYFDLTEMEKVPSGMVIYFK